MKKKLLAPLLFLGLIILIAAGYKYITYTSNLKPLSSSIDQQIVKIEPGTSASGIADILQGQQIIKSSSDFNLYLRLNGKRDSLQAGTYQLSPSMSVSEIVDIISSGKVTTRKLTIAPGLNVSEIKNVFSQNGFSQADIDQAFLDIKPKDYIEGVNADSLEGYIAPDTYIIAEDSSVRDFLILALEQFESNLSPELVSGLGEQGLSVNGATILASIVQQESSLPENHVKIAQVFLKRLDEGISLGSDVTFFYAAEQLGVDPAVDLDSPYNTRIYTGLPPTPIGNFNPNVLQAVANPSDTDYLFFVAGDDGITYFTNTLSEHEAAVREHCIELCKL